MKRLAVSVGDNRRDALALRIFGEKLVFMSGFEVETGGAVDVSYTSALDALALVGQLLVNRGVPPSSNRRAIGQDLVNQEASKQLRLWISANRNMVPGVDLSKVFGI